MKNAKEMNQTAKNFHEKETLRNMVQAQEYLEQEVSKEIEKSASLGHFSVVIDVDLSKYHLSTIAKILIDLGYQVSRTKWGNQIKIYW